MSGKFNSAKLLLEPNSACQRHVSHVSDSQRDILILIVITAAILFIPVIGLTLRSTLIPISKEFEVLQENETLSSVAPSLDQEQLISTTSESGPVFGPVNTADGGQSTTLLLLLSYSPAVKDTELFNTGEGTDIIPSNVNEPASDKQLFSTKYLTMPINASRSEYLHKKAPNLQDGHLKKTSSNPNHKATKTRKKIKPVYIRNAPVGRKMTNLTAKEIAMGNSPLTSVATLN